MDSTRLSDQAPVNTSAGHLSVHLDDAHPPEVSFLFEQQARRLPFAILASLALDALVLAGLLYISRQPRVAAVQAADELPDQTTNKIVWLVQPGPGGGGGGGGNGMKEPPRRAELPGKDKITVPVAPVVTLQAPREAKNEPSPVEQLNIPARLLASGTDSLPGLLEAPPGPPTLSQGPGSGGGAGTGTGTGIGSGTGSGLGPGSGGGTGGGVYRPGSGVTSPVPTASPKPTYTAEAMRARIQGAVLVECVVQPTGQCSDIQVVRSLDPMYGLDDEAIRSVKGWRFRPGMRMGQPVPVLVSIEVTFTLR